MSNLMRIWMTLNHLSGPCHGVLDISAIASEVSGPHQHDLQGCPTAHEYFDFPLYLPLGEPIMKSFDVVTVKCCRFFYRPRGGRSTNRFG